MTYSGFVGRYAFVFAGRRGRRPLQIHRRGDSRIARLLLAKTVRFWDAEDVSNDNSKTIKDRGTRSLAVPRYVIFKQAWFSYFLFLPQAVCRLHQIAFFQARCSACKGILQSHRGSYI